MNPSYTLVRPLPIWEFQKLLEDVIIPTEVALLRTDIQL